MAHIRWLSIFCILSLCLAACGESTVGSNPDPDGPINDRDGDGLSDEEEADRGTNPDVADTDGDGLLDGDEVARGTDPTNPDSDGDGIPDGAEVDIGTDPLDPNDDSCAGDAAEAVQGSSGADIVFLIDTSGSMGAEANEVEALINGQLAARLDAGMIDYRIIMIADFPPDDGGDATDPVVCIHQPLSPLTQAQCDDPANLPVNAPAGARYFHYDTHVNSRDSLTVALAEFADPSGDAGLNNRPAQYLGGWGTLLRQDSIKFFIEITDDDASINGNAAMTAATFNNNLRAAYATMYPNADPLRYVWHSIVGVDANPAADGWPATVPVQPAQPTCDSSDFVVNNGSVYQNLSILTEGLRFPLCEPGRPGNVSDFTPIFNTVADSVIESVQLPCTFDPGSTGQGQVDLNRAAIVYRAGGSQVLERFQRVNSVDQCVDGAYFINNDIFELCPTTCDRVTADASGQINIRVGCADVIVR